MVTLYALFAKTSADYDVCIEDFWVKNSLKPQKDLGMEIYDTAGKQLFTKEDLHKTEEVVSKLLDFKLLDLAPDSAVFADSSMLGQRNDRAQ